MILTGSLEFMYYEEIKKYIEEKNKKLKIKEIKRLFPNILEEELTKIINNLELEQVIIYDNQENTIIPFPKNSCFYQNTIHITKAKNGFVGPNYIVPPTSLNGALTGDTVLIKTTPYINKETNRQISEVIKIIKRKKDYYVATYNNHCLNLYGTNETFNLPINPKDTENLIPGDRVLIKLPSKFNNYVEIIEFIGHKDDPNLDILTIAATYNIATKFSKETLREIANIPNTVSKSDLENRTDFTNYPIVTIDCDTTKDMDDAVYVRKLPNNNYELQVHIAHVSHYVKEYSAIYQDALTRANSTYMLNSVIPMLPHKLSNGICSLNEGEIRLTRSTIMEITPSGEIVDFYLTKGYIKSRKKMSYSKVNKILEENITPEDYLPYKENLKLMNELSQILERKFLQSGLIDFELPEITSESNSLGQATTFKQQPSRSAEKLIEYFMIAANICNAKFCSWNNIPTIYRIHDNPNHDKLTNALSFISSLGYRLKNIKNIDNPKVVQGILKSLRNYEEYPILSSILLRSMQKATYSTVNLGHYALSLESYAHSTSPIRRIADLEMQMALDKYDLFLTNPDNYDLATLEEELKQIAKNASQKERNSKQAEDEAILMQMAWYMEDKIGNSYTAYITEINEYGLLIKCENEVIGKVNFKDISGDYFEYNKESRNVKGRKTKITYAIGDKVNVKVLSASKEYHTVYFSILNKLKKTNQLKLALTND